MTVSYRAALAMGKWWSRRRNDGSERWMSVLRLERKRPTEQEGEKGKKLRSKSGKMQVRCAEAFASVWMLNQERLGRVLICQRFPAILSRIAFASSKGLQV